MSLSTLKPRSSKMEKCLQILLLLLVGITSVFGQRNENQTPRSYSQGLEVAKSVLKIAKEVLNVVEMVGEDNGNAIRKRLGVTGGFSRDEHFHRNADTALSSSIPLFVSTYVAASIAPTFFAASASLLDHLTGVKDLEMASDRRQAEWDSLAAAVVGEPECLEVVTCFLESKMTWPRRLLSSNIIGLATWLDPTLATKPKIQMSNEEDDGGWSNCLVLQCTALDMFKMKHFDSPKKRNA